MNGFLILTAVAAFAMRVTTCSFSRAEAGGDISPSGAKLPACARLSMTESSSGWFPGATDERVEESGRALNISSNGKRISGARFPGISIQPYGVFTNSSMVGVDNLMVERAARVWQLAGRAAQPRRVAA
ncbi:hypothetical protein AA12717_1963 [Gluconacetobacter sacchari DSM 12717]|uniref:Uncharacterized protein n=1 Tax=Gluconacetobacter sacchari DSM 12717 TaxID=1307940 RepID=A0ABQ0P758_9PROT|nr:hypothetical protein [Gluconacetobacter sacchari]GBQ25044.1 hypothetical protein AA12717_1963 [Gluconacetobacter sacchari DSM 12717]